MTGISARGHGLPAEIGQAMRPVSSDLTAAEIAISFDEGGGAALPGHVVYLGAQHAQVLVGSRVVGQIRMNLADSETHRVWQLADQIQEYVLETPWVTGATTWPRCLTGHTHPMSPQILGEDAWWVCPREKAIRVRIGRHPGCALTTENAADCSSG